MTIIPGLFDTVKRAAAGAVAGEVIPNLFPKRNKTAPAATPKKEENNGYSEEYYRLANAETGGEKDPWIRTRIAPKEGSTAYGPIQITKRRVEDALNRGLIQDPEVAQWARDRFIPHADTMLKHGRMKGKIPDYDPRFDYGGPGDFNDTDKLMYSRLGEMMIEDVKKRVGNDPAAIMKDWHGADPDSGYAERYNSWQPEDPKIPKDVGDNIAVKSLDARERRDGYDTPSAGSQNATEKNRSQAAGHLEGDSYAPNGPEDKNGPIIRSARRGERIPPVSPEREQTLKDRAVVELVMNEDGGPTKMQKIQWTAEDLKPFTEKALVGYFMPAVFVYQTLKNFGISLVKGERIGLDSFTEDRSIQEFDFFERLLHDAGVQGRFKAALEAGSRLAGNPFILPLIGPAADSAARSAIKNMSPDVTANAIETVNLDIPGIVGTQILRSAAIKVINQAIKRAYDVAGVVAAQSIVRDYIQATHPEMSYEEVQFATDFVVARHQANGTWNVAMTDAINKESSRLVRQAMWDKVKEMMSGKPGGFARIAKGSGPEYDKILSTVVGAAKKSPGLDVKTLISDISRSLKVSIPKEIAGKLIADVKTALTQMGQTTDRDQKIDIQTGEKISDPARYEKYRKYLEKQLPLKDGESHEIYFVKDPTTIKDVFGEKHRLAKGENIYIYPLENNKFLIKDGDYFIAQKSQADTLRDKKKWRIGGQNPIWGTRENVEILVNHDMGIVAALESEEAQILKKDYGFLAKRDPFDPSVLAFLEIKSGDFFTASDIRDMAQEPGSGLEDAARLARNVEKKNLQALANVKYSKYQIPGGTDYREVRILAPVEKSKVISPAEAKKLHARAEEINRIYSHQKISEQKQEKLLKELREIREKINSAGVPVDVPVFRSSHWEEDINVLAHVRINDRTTPDGKKVLFIEEIQSDWALEGRTRGFIDDKPFIEKLPPGHKIRRATAEEARTADPGMEVVKGEWVLVDANNQVTWPTGGDTEEEAMQNALEIIREDPILSDLATEQGAKINRRVPFHPLLKNWQSLALKRVIKEAVEGGYDYIAWTTGEQQVERYDLSKQIDSIAWRKQGKNDVEFAAIKDGETKIEKQVPEQELEKYIGKDAANKILDDIDHQKKLFHTNIRGELKGVDLKIGGEWAKNLYDKQIPNILKNMTDEPQVVVEINTGLNEPMKQPGIAITPELRRMVINQPEAGGRRPPEDAPTFYIDIYRQGKLNLKSIKANGYTEEEFKQIGLSRLIDRTGGGRKLDELAEEYIRNNMLYPDKDQRPVDALIEKLVTRAELPTDKNIDKSVYLKEKQEAAAEEDEAYWKDKGYEFIPDDASVTEQPPAIEPPDFNSTGEAEAYGQRTAGNESARRGLEMKAERLNGEIQRMKELPRTFANMQKAFDLAVQAQFAREALERHNQKLLPPYGDITPEHGVKGPGFVSWPTNTPKWRRYYAEIKRDALAAEKAEEAERSMKERVIKKSLDEAREIEGATVSPGKVKAIVNTLTGARKIQDRVITNERALLRLKYQSQVKGAQAGYALARREARHEAWVKRQTQLLVRGMISLSKRKMDQDYAEAIQAILQKFDLAKRSKKTLEKRASLVEFIAQQKIKGEDVYIPLELIEQAEKVSLNNMTLLDLNTLYETIKRLAGLGINKRKWILNKKEREYKEVLNEAIAQIKLLLDANKISLVKEGYQPPSAREKAPLQKIADKMDAFFAHLRKVEFIANTLDSWDPDGKIKQHVVYPIQDAHNEETLQIEYFFRKLADMYKGIQPSVNDQKKYVTTSTGKKHTREEIIGVYLNSLNEDNIRHLTHELGNQLTPGEIQEIIAKLRPSEKKFADEVIALIEELWPGTVRATKALTGIRPKKVSGTYFPITIDRDQNKLAQFRAAETDLFQEVFQQVSVWAGHTKARQRGIAPIELRAFRVIHGHIRRVIHYNTHAPTVKNVQRLVNDPVFRQAVTSLMGEHIYEQFFPWLRDVANPKSPGADASDKFLERLAGGLRHNATTAILGIKLSVSLIQGGSYTQTIAKVGAPEAFKALVEFWSNPVAMTRYIYDRDPQMLTRRNTFDRELHDWLESSEVRNILKGFYVSRHILYEMIRFVDIITTLPTWLSAYNKAMSGPNPDAEKAATYAGHVVRTTQPAGSMKDLAAISKGSNFKKLWVMFYTHFSNYHNLMAETLDYLRLGPDPMGDKMAEAARRWFWIIVAPAVFATLVRSGFSEKDTKAYARNIMTYAFSGIPGVRDVASAIINRRYEPITSPALSLLDQIRRLGLEATGAQRPERIAEHAIKTAGYAGGLPTEQGWLIMSGLIDLMTGQTNDPRRLIWSKYALSQGNTSDKMRALADRHRSGSSSTMRRARDRSKRRGMPRR